MFEQRDGSGLARGFFATNGLVAFVAGAPLVLLAANWAEPAGVAAPLLRLAGVGLLAWGVLMELIAWRRPFLRRVGLWATVGDALYVLLSALLLAFGGNLLGEAARLWVAVVAVAVAVMVIGQSVGLRRLTTAAPGRDSALATA